MRMLENSKLDRFFNENPEYLEIFQTIRSYIESLGKVNIKTTKTQISFGTRRQFAWIWLPPFKVKNRPEKYFVLGFCAEKRIEHKKIVGPVEPYPGRWTHHVIIEKGSDLDETVFNWLSEAYEYSLRTRSGKKDEKGLFVYPDSDAVPGGKNVERV